MEPPKHPCTDMEEDESKIAVAANANNRAGGRRNVPIFTSLPLTLFGLFEKGHLTVPIALPPPTIEFLIAKISPLFQSGSPGANLRNT